MKIENWNKNTAEVSAWLEQGDYGDVGQAIALSITLGDNSPSDDLRSVYWTAIRSIGTPYESFPKARRGRESSLPENVELSAISVKNAVVAAFAGISNSELLMTVILPHGRTGGAYDSIESFADAGFASRSPLWGGSSTMAKPNHMVVSCFASYYPIWFYYLFIVQRDQYHIPMADWPLNH